MDAMGWCEMTLITVVFFFTPRVSPISRFFFDQDMHPGKLTWNPQNGRFGWKVIFPFQLDDFLGFKM